MPISLPSFLSVVALLALLAACEAAPPTAPAKAAPAVEVELVAAIRKTIPLQQEMPGRLQAVRTAEVRAQVEGIVEQILFTEGTEVQAGALLYRLDARALESHVRSAQALLDRSTAERHLAQQTLDRIKTLASTRVASRQERDQAEAQLKKTTAEVAGAEAALRRAQIDLEHAHITAPIGGRIGRTRVTEGALVGQKEATHLTTIEQIDPIRVNFTQSGPEFFRMRQAIRQGNARPVEQVQLQLRLEENSAYPFPGTLLFTDLAVEPQTGSVALRAEFPNADKILLPGQFVRVTMTLATSEGITVPQRAVQASPQGQSVLMVDPQNKVFSRAVKTGGFSGQDWIILEGLQPGEKVIVNGVQKARPGSPVTPKVLEAVASPPAAAQTATPHTP
ncbi:MAG: efflux RND transporter periplasmic adaptor subunit [Magnetococcales bacterium]|nr:efflux RND transporter periplasmic adaptor subunit [Magnetococcales bacterium]